MSNLHYPKPIVVQPPQTATATAIILHGLGDTGSGWADIAPQFHGDKLRHVRFIFPSAPTRPVTVNGGHKMPAWYDVLGLDAAVRVEDEAGLLEGKRYVEELVAKEVASGIPSTRVAVGGFSQGGALSLLMLRSSTKLAAVVGMSTYLPLAKAKELVAPENKATPVLMCHGDSDTLVSHAWGLESQERLEAAGASVEFRTYNGMAHSACRQEMQDVQAFLLKHLPPN